MLPSRSELMAITPSVAFWFVEVLNGLAQPLEHLALPGLEDGESNSPSSPLPLPVSRGLNEASAGGPRQAAAPRGAASR